MELLKQKTKMYCHLGKTEFANFGMIGSAVKKIANGYNIPSSLVTQMTDIEKELFLLINYLKKQKKNII
jgi:hypothetical protein